MFFNRCAQSAGVALSSLFVFAITIVLLGTPVSAAGVVQGAPEVGDIAPEMIIEELAGAPEGSVATIESLKGKVVVLEFWATWCAPCIGAFPHLNELVEHYKDSDDVVFIAITNESQETAAKVLDKKELNTWHGFDTDGSVWESYGVNAIPRTIIIGKDGKVAADTYPTMVSVDALELVRANKDPGLSSMNDLMGGDHDGGMPNMPKTMAELNSMQLQATEPDEKQEQLNALAGTWDVTDSVSFGPMAPAIESESRVTREWIQGGRVLLETSPVEGEDGLYQYSYFGFDREKGKYYMFEISPMEPAPKTWYGEWDGDEETFVFTNTMEVMMGGMGNEDLEKMELTMLYSIDLSDPHRLISTVSIDFGDAGMGMPGGKQEMSKSVAVPAKTSL